LKLEDIVGKLEDKGKHSAVSFKQIPLAPLFQKGIIGLFPLIPSSQRRGIIRSFAVNYNYGR